jgi:hypothetical protein
LSIIVDNNGSVCRQTTIAWKDEIEMHCESSQNMNWNGNEGIIPSYLIMATSTGNMQQEASPFQESTLVPVVLYNDMLQLVARDVR